jgi:hypothetical protein
MTIMVLFSCVDSFLKTETLALSIITLNMHDLLREKTSNRSFKHAYR